MSALQLMKEQRQDLLARALTVNEIFLSLQGETSRTGLPTVFIRLTGCPLRCRYCDTEYAFHQGEKTTIGAILNTVTEFNTRHVTVTGGEPLAQKNCLHLLTQLCDEGYQVSLETSGALDISGVDPRVSRILDLKTPGSGEEPKNLYSNLALLSPRDEIKIVICDRHDYEWAQQQLNEHRLNERCEVLFSPAHDVLDARILADWILQDKLPARLQIQLHKYLWGNERGH